jgi:hypothetical protein
MNLLFDSLSRVRNMDDLDHVYSVLRDSWQTDWMTLPVVLDVCRQVLFSAHEHLDGQLLKMLEAAMRVTEAIESISQEHLEPHYHNRLHIADALTGLTALLKLQTSEFHLADRSWLACLLLTVSAHDFKHPGGANQSPHEIETHSLQALAPLLADSDLDPSWRSVVHHLILKTDPLDVPDNHATVQGFNFAWNLEWACVLVNEADILASASSVHGPGLSESLASEWKRADHPLHSVVATAAGRQHFLKSILFSSPASHRLGVKQTIQSQLAQS